MTVDDFRDVMDLALLAAKFSFRRPDPATAWEVFMALAAKPVECEDSYLFWEASQDFFDFVREFSHRTEDGAVWHEQLTIHFTAHTAARLDIRPTVVFSKDHSDYPEFFAAVGRRPEFRLGLEFRHWKVELRLDGC